MVDYKFYNANPLKKIEQDCVCRAISRATRLSYKNIEHKLKLIGELCDCDELCVCCYNHLLENVFGLKSKKANGKLVRDVVNDYNENILLLRLEGHLTMAEFGVVYDLWDCRDEKVDIFWIVD